MIRLVFSAGLALFLVAAVLARPAFAQTGLTTDPTSAPAGDYKLDKAHTSVTLRVSHLGLSYYTLRFRGVEASYDFDPAHPEAAKLQVTIDANSVDTGDSAFDRQIASEVLETARFPQIRFISTSVRPTQEGRGTVSGDLSLHGVTKPVTLDVIFNGAAHGQAGEWRMGFSATMQFRRSDFGVAKYRPMVGDEMSVMVEAEFQK